MGGFSRDEEIYSGEPDQPESDMLLHWALAHRVQHLGLYSSLRCRLWAQGVPRQCVQHPLRNRHLHLRWKGKLDAESLRCSGEALPIRVLPGDAHRASSVLFVRWADDNLSST